MPKVGIPKPNLSTKIQISIGVQNVDHKMQRTEILTQNQVIGLIEFIISDSKNELYESYSDMEKEIIRFSNSTEFYDYLLKGILNNVRNFTFGIYNPASKGKFNISKIELNPKYCKGNTYRYRIDGWAIIFIDLKLVTNSNDVECRVSVNSKKRAENWLHTNPELWDWKNVESITRKIINKLKNYTQSSSVS